MTFLSSHLPFPPVPSLNAALTHALPQRGTHLVVSDTLTAPAQFALFHLVIAAVQLRIPVVWVDFRAEGRASWETVCRKLGTPLPSPSSSGLFHHIAPTPLTSAIPVSSHLAPGLFDPKPTLIPTFKTLLPFITVPSTASDAPSLSPSTLIILDGLSELLYMGFTPVDIARFVRAVNGEIQTSGAVLVSTLHADHLPRTVDEADSAPSSERDLLDRLLRIGGGWWRVSGLASGRSGDVTGEISSHPLDTALDGNASFPTVSRSAPLQYRLEASAVKVFAKGTGRGFL